MRPSSLGKLAALVLIAPGCDVSEPRPPDFRALPLGTMSEPVSIAAPDAAVCSIKVRNHGTKAMETDYLPNVVACEAPGNASLEMLEAQAIAARSYAYFHALTEGQICNGQGCQVFSCGRTPTALHREAVANTSGVVLRHNDNLTVGFYVAGDKTPNADCTGNSSGVANTEKWVTYNQGKSGTGVKQTGLGWRHQPSDGDYGQNRGALSQWGAHCLADNHGFTATEILRFYYGEDIELQATEGACVGDPDIDVDEEPKSCGELDADGVTVIDNEDDCFDLEGPLRFWRTENRGHGGTLRWTKSTHTSEHNVAVWKLDATASGNYRLEVHIDSGFDAATDARYEVVSAFSAREIEIDQTAGGWIDLGVFPLDADAADQQVRMTDAIGIAGQVLQADALRITREHGEECTDADCHADTPGTGDADRGGSGDAGCQVGGDNPRADLTFLLLLAGVAGIGRRRAD